MRIDPAGWPFIIGGAAVALLPGLLAGWPWAVPGAFVALACLFFFRDPERAVPAVSGAVLSPADGRVMIAGPASGRNQPPGIWQQISIFLSPLDVHVNRMPLSGRVTRVDYHPGSFLPAYRTDAGDLNEYYEVWLQHDGQSTVVRQIVGVLARRIVCRTKVGAAVTAGERYGVMKFGSRMDVFLPMDARLRVAAGDRVTGGITVIAELARRGPDEH